MGLFFGFKGSFADKWGACTDTSGFLGVSVSLIHRAVCCSVLQCVAVCCSVLQMCCSVLQSVALIHRALLHVCYAVVQCVAACCSVLQRVAACCSMLQFVTGCCADT